MKMKVNNKLGRSYCPQTPQKFIRERQTRCFTSQVWNGATLLNYLFPVKAQKEWKWNPSLWQDSLCDDLHSPRGSCSPAPSPRLFPTTLSPPPATFLPQPDTSPSSHHIVSHLQQRPAWSDKSLSLSTIVSGKHSGKTNMEPYFFVFAELAQKHIYGYGEIFTHSPTYPQ